MSTLNNPQFQTVTHRMMQQDNQHSPQNDAVIGSMSKEEQLKLMQSKTDYLALYSRLKSLPLSVSAETAELLYMLTRSTGATNIVEYGTSIGLSTLHFAAALKDNGQGSIISCEFEPGKIAQAKANLAETGLQQWVEIREGDALKTLSTNLPDNINLVLLDGAKALYLDILKILEPQLAPSAIIVADNANFCPEYLSYIRIRSNGYLSLPFDDDVEMSMRLSK
ncbi:O-methyltransferase [Neptunicella marina]|uniref:Class I SAM-dependent methyltransferase n=1 Tax=Neptunicella marina TaxID=2125989 RepID=A0A8J6ITK0_9ALTE|nr:class I SAM-dependent methyltransferase [Neptunicella marina]MBC3766064.1 class I SAM-dependent methyltransferase [Neptunicella marina]